MKILYTMYICYKKCMKSSDSIKELAFVFWPSIKSQRFLIEFHTFKLMPFRNHSSHFQKRCLNSFFVWATKNLDTA